MSNSIVSGIVDAVIEYNNDPIYYDVERCDRDYVALMMGYGAYTYARDFLVKNYNLNCDAAKEVMVKIKARIISGLEV